MKPSVIIAILLAIGFPLAVRAVPLISPAITVPPFTVPTHTQSKDVMPDEENGIPTSRPMVIEDSPGGSVLEYRLLGLKLAATHTPIILDGICASACTLLIDLDRDNVCITTAAILAYHMSYTTDEDGTKQFHPLVYETPGLNNYIAKRGGLPKDDVMLVPFEQAKMFYKPCPGADK